MTKIRRLIQHIVVYELTYQPRNNNVMNNITSTNHRYSSQMELDENMYHSIMIKTLIIS